MTMSTTRKTLTDEVELLELGYVAGVFGVRGEVRLHLHNRETPLLERPLDVHLAHGGRRWTAKLTTRPGAGGKVIGRIAGVTDRNAAEALKGATFSVPAALLPPLEEGEYYLREVVGMQVHEAGQKVGEVIAVHATGPVEVFELDGDRYLPSTADRLLSIDREARVIHIAEGALAV